MVQIKKITHEISYDFYFNSIDYQVSYKNTQNIKPKMWEQHDKFSN